MGRQTATDWNLETDSAGPVALDPGQLPVRFETHLACEGARAGRATRCRVLLSAHEVHIQSLGGPQTAALVAPTSAYAGVMVQIEPGLQPGTVMARLILKHHDAALSLVLVETDQPEGLAQSWPAWARALDLPMLVCDQGGTTKPIEAYRAEPKAVPAPRRKLALLTGRRPRFLVRRRVGNPDGMVIHRDEAELTVRS